MVPASRSTSASCDVDSSFFSTATVYASASAARTAAGTSSFTATFAFTTAFGTAPRAFAFDLTSRFSVAHALKEATA
ncbi:MAG: hypothetical protein C4334_05370 [Pyrinomonas sp.]